MGSQQFALCFKTDLIATTHWGLALTVLFIQTQFPDNFGMPSAIPCVISMVDAKKHYGILPIKVTKFNAISLVTCQ